MRYNDPVSAEGARQPVGLDAELIQLRDAFNAVDWLNGYVFLRAYENRFEDEVEGTQIVPQVYVGDGEYYNTLFNDNLPACVFFKTNGRETIGYERPKDTRLVTYTRPLSLIFWGNLKQISAAYKADYIYTELIKEEFIEVLGKNKSLISIDSYTDDPIEEVFAGYTLPENRNIGKYPFCFFKIDFTIQYKRGIVRC